MSKVDGYLKRRDTLTQRCITIKAEYPGGVVDKQVQKELDEAEKQIKNLGRKIEALQAEQARSSK